MKTLQDPEFSRVISLADAYRVLYKFVEQYNARGETSTLDLVSDIALGVWKDGSSADPAQLEDFLAVVEEVLGNAGPGA